LFWSKIWLFLVVLAAAAALTIALALPRSAHKSRIKDERQRLVVACDVVTILLEAKAQDDVEVTANFSRDTDLVAALGKVKADQNLVPTDGPSKDLLDIANDRMGRVDGDKPTLAVITDRTGRVVTRVGVDEGQIGDVVAGRFLIDDALAGYVRDDVWFEGGAVYMVAASPVVSRARDGDAIIGAAVLGWKLDNELADGFVEAFKDTDDDAEDQSMGVAFFAEEKKVTASTTPATLDGDLLAEFARVDKPAELGKDCRAIAPFYAKDNKVQYAAVLSRLPGEANHNRAFYAVFTRRPAEATFGGAVGKAKRELGGGFPWAVVVILFVVGLGGGVGLMLWESDLPLRRLQADAVRLAKGERERLHEEDHGGRFGSIARSVNIQIDKLQRDAKAAKKDLDQLLGPAPEGSLGALDLLGGTPLPGRPAMSSPGMGIPMAPPPAPAAPPPSEFKFSDGGSAPKRPAPAPDLDLGAPTARVTPARPAAPPAALGGPPPRPPVPGGRSPTPPPRPPVPAAAPAQAPKKPGFEDDILASFQPDEPSKAEPVLAGPAGPDPDEPYFREVFDQFVALKKQCGEPTGGLTLAKFGEKLRKNRADLMSKTGCQEVKFTVYVKDGKAALKATPVKDA
jgi:hypothetical protein